MIKSNTKIIDQIMEKYDVKNKIKNLKGEFTNLEEFKNVESSILKQIEKSISTTISECLLFDYEELKEHGDIIGTNRNSRLSYFDQNILNEHYLGKLFKKYPLMDKIMNLNINDILNSYLKIINSYHTDLEKITKNFEHYYGIIKDIDISAGDIHYGKTVAKVILQNGVLFYKPRQIVSDQLFEELCSFISNGIKQDIDLKIPKYYISADCSWQEHIIQKACSNMEEVHRYFYRCGAYLSLFFVLGTNDLHCENVIADGEYPMFIDLETIAQGVNNDYSVTCGFKDIKSSVLNTSLLPLRRLDNLLDINVSALFTDTKASHTKFVDVLIPDEENDWIYEKKPFKMSSKANSVYLKDKPVKPNTVKNDIVSGFIDGMMYIVNHKSKFVKIIESYKSKNLITRVILRPTSVYGKFINALHHPESLASQSVYENIINIFAEGFELGKFGYLRLEKEIEALEHGYIPAFECDLFTTEIRSNNEVICENYFTISAFDNIKMKLEKIDTKTIDYQLQLIEMSLIMPYEKKEILNVNQCKTCKTIDKSKFMDELSIYLEKISERIIPIGSDSASLLFLELGKDNFFINELNSSMYNCGGLIWLLAIGGKSLKNQNYLSIAENMMQFINDNFKYMKLQNIMDQNISIYTGVGGIAYLNYNLYKLTNKRYYKDTYKYVQDSIIDNLCNREFKLDDLDYLYGITSTITFLCKVYLDNHDEKLKQSLYNLYDKFVSVVQNNWSNLAPGYAHGFTSIYSCLSYLIKICNKSGDINLIQKMIEAENNILSSLNMSWCKGKAGIVLARHIIDNNLKTNYICACSSITQSEIDEQKELCLCHGVYGIIDILITLEKDNFIKNIDISNSKFYEDLNQIKLFYDNDYLWESYMLGVTGIAYVTLRQTDHSIPSIISLDIYEA